MTTAKLLITYNTLKVDGINIGNLFITSEPPSQSRLLYLSNPVKMAKTFSKVRP